MMRAAGSDSMEETGGFLSRRQAGTAPTEAKTKRAKVTAEETESVKDLAEYEIQVGDEIYVNVDVLLKFLALKSYFSKCYE
ncbi:hypothetical protein BBJ28_00023824 [Nothophytophthora sp. Chile5]|nr:hypothetical protein BBJ28_00023824 [Nothophytophthora sp. Chile5]